MSPEKVEVRKGFYVDSLLRECNYCGKILIPGNEKVFKYVARYPDYIREEDLDTGLICTDCAKSKEEARVIYLYKLAGKIHGR